MGSWKLLKEAVSAAEAAGYTTREIRGGNSPYSDFDLLISKEEIDFAKPCKYTVSEVSLKTVDPALAYKGRHGVGRMILVEPSDDGIAIVPSNDAVEFSLADGTPLGKRHRVTLGDFFPKATAD